MDKSSFPLARYGFLLQLSLSEANESNKTLTQYYAHSTDKKCEI